MINNDFAPSLQRFILVVISQYYYKVNNNINLLINYEQQYEGMHIILRGQTICLRVQSLRCKWTCHISLECVDDWQFKTLKEDVVSHPMEHNQV